MEMTYTKHPLRIAIETRDTGAAAAILAPHCVLWSPATRVPFEGREAVLQTLAGLVETYDEIEYTHELHDGDTVVLAFRATLAGRPVEAVDVLHLDTDGLVDEIRVYGRPLTSGAQFAAVLGPIVARERRGPGRAALVRALTRSLPGMLARADSLAARLLRPR
jgi:SnoaL-like domain